MPEHALRIYESTTRPSRDWVSLHFKCDQIGCQTAGTIAGVPAAKMQRLFDRMVEVHRQQAREDTDRG